MKNLADYLLQNKIGFIYSINPEVITINVSGMPDAEKADIQAHAFQWELKNESIAFSAL